PSLCTLSLHDALPIFDLAVLNDWRPAQKWPHQGDALLDLVRSNAEDGKRLGLHAPSATESSSSATSALTLRVVKRGMPELSDQQDRKSTRLNSSHLVI